MGGWMIRFEDWPSRLLAAVHDAERTPFAWGSHDCALFAANVVQSMTGEDFAAPFRGRYSTGTGALLALRSNGAEDLADYVTRVLGEPIAPALARRGDVVMFSAAEGDALGVVVGAEAAAAGPQGITWIPMAAWSKAWRV